MDESLHTFTIKTTFAHEDEGTASSSAASVIKIVENVKNTFPGVVTSRQLSRSMKVILEPKGFTLDKTLLVTSFCCDEVCRDLEDELKKNFGQNFNLGGIAGFPFGGNAAFGAMAHHVPTDGHIVICYGPHVGIDFDGVVGKVNRRGHTGSGACCNTAIGALAYVKAVKTGCVLISSPEVNDPTDAQQVFINHILMDEADRLLDAGEEKEMIELPHAIFDAQGKLLKRIMDKCCPSDIKKGTKIALLGGIQINSPEGTPEYFLPKKFHLLNSNGEFVEDLTASLVEEGTKDIKQVIKETRLKAQMDAVKQNLAEVPIMEG